MNKLHSKIMLLKILKESGLPHSYPSLLRYERKGIIKKPKGSIHYDDRIWRFYTIEEINAIASILRRHLNKKRGISKRNNPNVDRKEYRRNWAMRQKYGIEPSEFDIYWIAYRGKCFLCQKNMKMPSPTRGQGLDIVAIDHNHKNGKVRGLLCNACNKGLGFFGDSISLLEEAVKYLKGD